MYLPYHRLLETCIKRLSNYTPLVSAWLNHVKLKCPLVSLSGFKKRHRPISYCIIGAEHFFNTNVRPMQGSRASQGRVLLCEFILAKERASVKNTELKQTLK